MHFKKLVILFCFIGCLQAQAQTGIVYQWAGAVTDSSVRITVQAQVPSYLYKYWLDTSITFSNPIQSNTLLPDSSNNNIYTTTIYNLQPNTKYYYVLVNGNNVSNSISEFRTASYNPHSFSFGVASCSNSGAHVVYNVIDSLKPNFFVFSGDLHYYDPNSANINAHRIPYTVTLSQPNIKNFLRHTPIVYTWDDHDFAGNNSDGSAIGKHSAYVSYRQCVPHYPLALQGIDNAIYQSFDYGRLHFILTDLRSERILFQNIMSGMQMQWLKNELLIAKQKKQLAVWISSVSYSGQLQLDNWSEFYTEREQLSNFFRDSAIANLLIICGDAHMLAIDDGTNNHYETGTQNLHQYPIFQAAALNRFGSVKGGSFTSGVFPNPTFETGQFGIVNVDDNGGDTICINLQGFRTDSVGQNTSIITSYTFCRNLESDIIYTKEISQPSMPEVSFTIVDGNKIRITNTSSQLIESIYIADALGKEIFRVNNLEAFKVVDTSLPTLHGFLLLVAKNKEHEIVKKIAY